MENYTFFVQAGLALAGVGFWAYAGYCEFTGRGLTLRGLRQKAAAGRTKEFRYFTWCPDGEWTETVIPCDSNNGRDED